MNYPIIAYPEPGLNTDEFHNSWSSTVRDNYPVPIGPEKPGRVNYNPSLSQVMNNLFSQVIYQPRESEGYFNQVFYMEDLMYSHSNLFSDIQDMLCCLAPFTSVINIKGVERYIFFLKQQPALSHLPFDLWPEMMDAAKRRGLVSPDPMFLHVKPVFPYFLKTRLYVFERREKRQGVETAFVQYYDRFADAVSQLIESDKADEKALARILVEPEYENLLTAMNFAMNAHGSIFNIYHLLSCYLDITGEDELRVRLGDIVLAGLNDYPRSALVSELGAEFVAIIDDIARHYLSIGRYQEAERSYQIALAIWLENETYHTDHINWKSSAFYHQLGRVAHEQGKWKKAQTYFLKDLEISKKYNDLQGMTTSLRNLSRLWEKGGDQELPGAVAEVLR